VRDERERERRKKRGIYFKGYRSSLCVFACLFVYKDPSLSSPDSRKSEGEKREKGKMCIVRKLYKMSSEWLKNHLSVSLCLYQSEQEEKIVT